MTNIPLSVVSRLFVSCQTASKYFPLGESVSAPRWLRWTTRADEPLLGSDHIDREMNRYQPSTTQNTRHLCSHPATPIHGAARTTTPPPITFSAVEQRQQDEEMAPRLSQPDGGAALAYAKPAADPVPGTRQRMIPGIWRAARDIARRAVGATGIRLPSATPPNHSPHPDPQVQSSRFRRILRALHIRD